MKSIMGKKYTVNVRGCPSCSCRQSELSGIPCAHMIKALWEENKKNKPETYVSDWFKTSRWEKCYEVGLNPINGINMWKGSKDVKVLPPPVKIPKGKQPSNKRRLESWEPKPKRTKKPKIQMTCSNCGLKEHNKATCQNKKAAPSSSAPKRGRG